MTEFPRVLVYDGDDEPASGERLAAALRDLEIEAPFVLASQHGATLARALPAACAVTPAKDADQEWALETGARAKRSGADAVVAIGGGRCIDIGKLTAARAGVRVVSAPTQLSHDGLCSPVAVVPDRRGRAQSLGAIAPQAVFVSLPTLLGAPTASIAAGIGDLLANPPALKDWALAADRGLENIDQRAWDMSVASFDAIQPLLEDDAAISTADPRFLRALADALVLSGKAMICAGSSRPASGGEHEISHAIDDLYPGRAMHGAQVAFGCIVSAALYGDDVRTVRARLRRLSLPQHPSELGLSNADMVQVILHAPDTRPGRFTIVEEADLDTAGAERLVKEIWGE